ncbi:hypothetical protein M5K25_009409 [Dendrobium thyrsiflorum]|uniref:Uncharacterized protein n=1 Tax=Dendrobium thyrsiflorum TaxID=117978 RepID=A0ABD0V695_DENTH
MALSVQKNRKRKARSNLMKRVWYHFYIKNKEERKKKMKCNHPHFTWERSSEVSSVEIDSKTFAALDCHWEITVQKWEDFANGNHHQTTDRSLLSTFKQSGRMPKGTQSQSLKRSRERSKTALAPLLLLNHRRSFAGPLLEGPTVRRTTASRPYSPPDHRLKALQLYTPPDHRLKALQSAGPPPEGPTVRRTTTSRPDILPKARHPAQGSTFYLRSDVLPKARLVAQGQTFFLRADVLLKARRSSNGPTLRLRPDLLLKDRRPAQGSTFYLRSDVLPKARLAAQGQTSRSRPDLLLKARRPAQGQTYCSRPDILLKARHSA